MSKSWEEVQGVLDDPYVSADVKEALLFAYVRENGGLYNSDDLPREIRDYTDGTKAEYNFRGDHGSALLGTDQIYDLAQEESEEDGYAGRQAAENVEDGRTTIDGMQPPVEGSTRTGVQKSDEIFDAARPALKLWQDFLPINDKVPSDTLGRYGKIRLKEDIEDRFNEQMGISFRNFMDDAARVRDAYGTLSELNTNNEAELNNLYKDWTGPAANASYQYYSTKMQPNVRELLEYLETAPDMIGTAVENIFTACKDKANDVIALYQGVRGTIGSATPDIANKVVELAAGNFNDEDWDKILEVAAWVDAMTGANLESTIRDDGGCSINDENRDYVIRECKKWIRDSFNADLHENLYVNFKQACDDALEAVNLHYETLNTYLKEYENEFGEALPPPTTNQPPPGTSNPPPGTSNPPPGTSSPPPGSSSPPPGSSSPPPGSSPPPIDTPSPSSPPPIDTPGTSDPSGPGADQADLTDPNGTGDPTDPTTPTSPGGGDQEETVTIRDGDREIAVTSPDGQGVVTVTVDDGSGQPKTYTMDFGAADATTLPGSPAGPGTPGTPGTSGSTDGTGDFGPNGRPPTVPGPDTPIEPGPDGKCVITDGDLTITAERPAGQPDTVVVTVDDGTGNPTTYNLDYSEANTEPTATPVAQPHQVSGDNSRPAFGAVPQELVDANAQVDQVDFTPAGDRVSTQPAYGEVPQNLQSQPVSTQPAYGEFPGQGVSTQPAYGEMPASPRDQPSFATTASAANDPSMSGFSSDAGGQAGSFGLPDQQSYMHGPGGEAGLPSASDVPGMVEPSGAPGGQPDQSQAHPGMAGGGMPMMGAPGGGGGSGDSERAGSQWRTTGDLFDEPADPQRFRGAFGGEGN